MDIKVFTGDKELIAPIFDFTTKNYNNNNILILCIKSFSIEEQNHFFNIINTLNKDNLFINSEYITITNKKEIYYFSLENYEDYKFENSIISGYYHLMFAFVTENDTIIKKKYIALDLKGIQFKKL